MSGRPRLFALLVLAALCVLLCHGKLVQTQGPKGAGSPAESAAARDPAPPAGKGSLYHSAFPPFEAIC